MRGRKVALAAAVVVLAASAFAAGRCVRPGPHPGATGAAAATARRSCGRRSRRSRGPPSARRSGRSSRYAAAVDAAHRDGLRVWIEADLRKRWFAGPAVVRRGRAAGRPSWPAGPAWSA